MSYELSIDVPIPFGYTACKYPFAEMDIGHSFALEEGDDAPSVRTSAAQWARRFAKDRKYSVRKMGDGTTRCFRVA